MPSFFSKSKTTKKIISQPLPTALPTLEDLQAARHYTNIAKAPPPPRSQYSFDDVCRADLKPSRLAIPHKQVESPRFKQSRFREHLENDDSSVSSLPWWGEPSLPSSSQSSLQSLVTRDKMVTRKQDKSLPPPPPPPLPLQQRQVQRSDPMMRRGLSQRYKSASQSSDPMPTSPVTSRPLDTRTRTDTRLQGRWLYAQTTRLSPKERKALDKSFLQKKRLDKTVK